MSVPSPSLPTSTLSVGDVAPDFSLPDQVDRAVSLTDFRGQKAVLLVFYPFAFSGICTGELTEIRDELGDFVSDDVQVLTISCDPVTALRAWADREGYFFPLLSDFWPHGEVAKAYGVLDQQGGYAVRGTFLIDSAGVLRWSDTQGIYQRRDFDSYRAALAELTGGSAA